MSGTLTLHPPLTAPAPNGVRLGNTTAQVAANGTSFTNVFAGPRTLRVQIPGYEHIPAYGTVQTGQTTDLDAEAWRLDPPSNVTFTRTNDSRPSAVGTADKCGRIGWKFWVYAVYLDSFLLDTMMDLTYHTRNSARRGRPRLLDDRVVRRRRIAADRYHPRDVDGRGQPGPAARCHGAYALSPAYPNPFNPTTSLDVSLPHNMSAQPRVYDITGREVAVISNGLYAAGVHRFTWNAEGTATGVYFARLESSFGTQIQKLLLLK